MQFRTLQITLLSGKNLPSEKMAINAVVSISNEIDGSKQEHTTPTWNSQMEFKVDETALQEDSLALELKLLCKHVVIGSLKVSVKELFDSRKSPYVGGELTFSYKFIDESAPNASGSGPGWNRVENATKAAADGAGVAIKAAADGAGAAIKAAGVGIKAAAKVADGAMLTLLKSVKSGGLGGKKDGKEKDVEAGWWPWGANKKNDQREKAWREQMNAVIYKPQAQQAPTSSKPGPSQQNSASTENAKTQGQNSGLRTGKATGMGTGTGTYNPFQTAANKFMSTDLGEAILGQGEGKTKTNPND